MMHGALGARLYEARSIPVGSYGVSPGCKGRILKQDKELRDAAELGNWGRKHSISGPEIITWGGETTGVAASC